MDVSITDFRAGLRSWVERAQRGEDVVLTERGVRVARLSAVQSATALDRLEREGIVTAATAPRPQASTRSRVTPAGPVAELVSELRR